MRLVATKNMMASETIVPAWPGSKSASARFGEANNVDMIQEAVSKIRGRPKGDLTSFTWRETTVLMDQVIKRIMALTINRACLLKS